MSAYEIHRDMATIAYEIREAEEAVIDAANHARPAPR